MTKEEAKLTKAISKQGEMKMIVVQVRIDAPNESAARQAAEIMGVQVNRVKIRDDCTQLYGSKAVAEACAKKDLNFVNKPPYE